MFKFSPVSQNSHSSTLQPDSPQHKAVDLSKHEYKMFRRYPDVLSPVTICMADASARLLCDCFTIRICCCLDSTTKWNIILSLLAVVKNTGEHTT